MIKKIIFVSVAMFALFLGVMTIKYGIEERFDLAYTCSIYCAINLLSTSMIWGIIQRK